MNNIPPENPNHYLYSQVRDILIHARSRVWQTVNHEQETRLRTKDDHDD